MVGPGVAKAGRTSMLAGQLFSKPPLRRDDCCSVTEVSTDCPPSEEWWSWPSDTWEFVMFDGRPRSGTAQPICMSSSTSNEATICSSISKE
mmetsp:Transcript_25095/g.57711  ORF Transcript_25095/g.57711 Transcript_25095/m.57711 type:complete len:91 (-) Transcript_25095:437-709(-)